MIIIIEIMKIGLLRVTNTALFILDHEGGSLYADIG